MSPAADPQFAKGDIVVVASRGLARLTSDAEWSCPGSDWLYDFCYLGDQQSRKHLVAYERELRPASLLEHIAFAAQ